MGLSDRISIVAIAGDIAICLDKVQIEHSVEEERIIGAIWRREKIATPSLFNGHIICYQSHSMLSKDSLIINCYITQYKYFLAQLKDERLQRIRPVCVSGVLIDNAKRILIGKRSDKVTEYKGYYEFVPSGGITPEYAAGKAYTGQLMTELEQETGILPAEVAHITPFCLILDHQHNVFDIGVKVILSGELEVKHLELGEYSQFVTVDFNSLRQFESNYNCVPTTTGLIDVLLGSHNG